jgi:transposase
MYVRMKKSVLRIKTMPAPYSLDLRKRVINDYQKKITQVEIAKKYNICLKTVKNWVSLFKKTNDIRPKEGYQNGHSHIIKDLDEFKVNLEIKNYTNMNEIIKDLGKGSTSSIGRALKKVNYVKKKFFLYKERDKNKRKDYLESIKDEDKSKIVYIDETGFSENDVEEYAWIKKGKVLIGEKKGKKEKRISLIARKINKKIIAPMTFEGYCNSDVFIAYIEQNLIKSLEKGQIVVMDNASFHKDPKIKTLIESVGCKLIYLPPYSPDLNPIEKFWATLKKVVRKMRVNMEELLQDALDRAIVLG